MINFEDEHNLTGGEHWANLQCVFVEGIPGQREVDSSNSYEENEEIIASWDNVVILRVTSANPAKFNFGFFTEGHIGCLKNDLTTDIEFATRIGNGDVNFFVIPQDLDVELGFRVINKTTVDDPDYVGLLLI